MPRIPADESVPDPAPRNDRAVYRAAYPASYPVVMIPHVLLDGETTPMPLLDCSEHGIRYRASPGESPSLGTPVMGVLQCHDQPLRGFKGHVVRAEPGEVAVRLDPPGLPFSLLLSEQRAVLVWTRTRAEQKNIRDAE